MKHARSDYDPIQDPREDGIPDDEPVFIVRAQDRLASTIVHEWAYLFLAEGGDEEVAEAVHRHADAMEDYAREHYDGGKLPDVPEGAMR